MTWNTFHHRGAILQTVVETADARRDGVLPWHLPGVPETFRDELDLLAALQLKWHARLSGNIERALMSEPLDLTDAIASAWRITSGQLPGVRKILDRYSETPSDPEMAAALNRAVRANPQEVYLVEGYTDAVGSDIDNLSLSDRRAQSVATVLSERFGVPPENLTTQGYGEQYLKVNTQEANRENRRVVVRRVTPLIQQGQADAAPR